MYQYTLERAVTMSFVVGFHLRLVASCGNGFVRNRKVQKTVVSEMPSESRIVGFASIRQRCLVPAWRRAGDKTFCSWHCVQQALLCQRQACTWQGARVSDGGKQSSYLGWRSSTIVDRSLAMLVKRSPSFRQSNWRLEAGRAQ